MDGMIQIHQGWFQAAVAGIAVLGLGWRVLSSFELRIEKHMDKLDSRMDKLDGRMDRLDSRLADLEKGQAHLQEKVENLRVRLDSIERKLDSGPLGVTTAIMMAGFKGQMAFPFPPTEPPPPAPQVEGE